VTGLVYALADPRDHRIRYVGKTQRTARQRLNGHVGDARRGVRKAAVVNWVGSLLAEGVTPEALVLEHVRACDDAYEREQIWIRRLRCDRLLNHCDRGPEVIDDRRIPDPFITTMIKPNGADLIEVIYLPPPPLPKAGAAP
jgi:GIY-YIG catalytic domain